MVNLKNVLLEDDEIKKLIDKYTIKYLSKIEDLSCYLKK